MPNYMYARPGDDDEINVTISNEKGEYTFPISLDVAFNLQIELEVVREKMLAKPATSTRRPFTEGDTVKITNVRPKYAEGLTGTVVSVTAKKISIRLDKDSAERMSKHQRWAHHDGQPFVLTVPVASCHLV